MKRIHKACAWLAIVFLSCNGSILAQFNYPPEDDTVIFTRGDYEPIFAGAEWVQFPSLREGFLSGHTFADCFSVGLFEQYLLSTLESMRESGAAWAILDNQRIYYTVDPPVIGSFGRVCYQCFRDAREYEIATMIKQVHSLGMKFALMIELTVDSAAAEERGYAHYLQLYGEYAQVLARKCIDRDLPSGDQYWDEWFRSFRETALFHAHVAAEHGADMLIIAKQILAAICPGNEDRWRNLIAEVRTVYPGPIAMCVQHGPEKYDADFIPGDALDYLVIQYELPLSSAKNPSMKELREAFEYYNDTLFEPLSTRYDVPIIFLAAPFMSCSTAANQVWFEWGQKSECALRQRDLLIQAKMYEALLQAISDEAWAAGLWTWGY